MFYRLHSEIRSGGPSVRTIAGVPAAVDEGRRAASRGPACGRGPSAKAGPFGAKREPVYGDDAVFPEGSR